MNQKPRTRKQKRRLRRLLVAVVLAVTTAVSAAGSTSSERLAERGPATLVVGTIFTLTSPPALFLGRVRGQPVALHACRFGHGVKMLAAGAALLPAALLAAPFDYHRLPDGWMDGVVDAFQEDYCTRPVGSILP